MDERAFCRKHYSTKRGVVQNNPRKFVNKYKKHIRKSQIHIEKRDKNESITYSAVNYKLKTDENADTITA